VAFSRGHEKIILYANPGTEAFYGKLGFLPMNAAMRSGKTLPAPSDPGCCMASPDRRDSLRRPPGIAPRVKACSARWPDL
jgi:hypothetical protein